MTMILLLVGTPAAVGLAVWLAVRAIRWAKKQRALAAAMMTGTYLDDVEGGKIETNDDSTVTHFLDWLGGKVDAVSYGSAPGAHEVAHSSDAASYDGGVHHSSADSCGGGDSGGACSGD